MVERFTWIGNVNGMIRMPMKPPSTTEGVDASADDPYGALSLFGAECAVARLSSIERQAPQFSSVLNVAINEV
jgi:hypothetical protein